MNQPQQPNPKSSNQAGFTIIESLLALMVVTILMVGLSPIIVLSVATRVQARRVELAATAAKTYVDGVRSRVIDAPEHAVAIPQTGTAPNQTPDLNQLRTDLAGIAPPPASTFSGTCTANSYCSNTANSSLYCIDQDETLGCQDSSMKDVIIQAYRSAGSVDQGYFLNVRVYRADAFKTSDKLKTMQADQAKANPAIGTLGNAKEPLMEMTTEISPENPNHNNFCQRLGGCS
ncbi:MAG: hormogonium polysaccharide secretion pseudopilin HpsB [Coleofasciculus sp. G3-WIS-01]|uniref:hormogonium polysaccharide secretion pseudopilin HpsB n=1 Tax=Coleofasciculus sp. G3-WIS-01 TaxID=3069528 RepID=UPI0032F2DA3D